MMSLTTHIFWKESGCIYVRSENLDKKLETYIGIGDSDFLMAGGFAVDESLRVAHQRLIEMITGSFKGGGLQAGWEMIFSKPRDIDDVDTPVNRVNLGRKS